jgi:cellulose synthase/poly-beta-1,6-N-acetylglucosamine synthase-like glycosyltransferase
VREQAPWSLAVVVPARDEEALVVGCLTALRRAIDAARPHVARVDTVLVADRCRDATVELATLATAGWGRVIEVDAGSAGAARAAGVADVLARHAGRRDRLWLANTDADTRVPPDWLARQLESARGGAVGVAGVVVVDSFAEHPDHVRGRWAQLYCGSDDVPHPHVHGANLGVRADAYLEVGGFDAGPAGEDHRLWSALLVAGHSTESPRSLSVVTSGRAASRAAGGFADRLVALAEAS